MKNYIYAHAETKDNYKRYKSITSKQWLVYYYLLSISHYNAERTEDHRFIYKKDLNISKTSSFLGISRPTIYTAIKNLIAIGLIREYSSSYSIYSYEWVKINTDVLRALLSFSYNNAKNIDLLRTYLLLKKLSIITDISDERAFTRRELILLLGHDDTTTENYTDVQIYLGLLSYWGLIELKSHIEQHEKLGHYTVYHLQRADEDKVNPELINNDIGEMSGSIMSEKIYNNLMFTMPELLENKD